MKLPYPPRLVLLAVILCFYFRGPILPELFAQDSRSPLAHTMAVADRTIAHSALKFRGTLMARQKAFREMELVDFGRSFGRSSGTAYAYTRLNSAAAQTLRFRVSYDGFISVWLNGKPAFSSNDGPGKSTVVELEREWQMPGMIELRLEQGVNEVVVRSTSGRNETWRLFLQPIGMQNEEGDFTAAAPTLTFDLQSHPLLSGEVASITNWLLLGPFKEPLTADRESDLLKTGVLPGALFEDDGTRISWTLPRTELVTDVFEADPLWGSLYDWNYHTGGVAWVIGKLGEYTGRESYNRYNENYCEFMLRSRPYVHHEKYTMGRLSSRFSRLINSPLLDFSVAPILPFAYRYSRFGDNSTGQYKAMVDSTILYLKKKQLRLPDGTLARETPRRYTLWVDDMFMGIPFMLEASRTAVTSREKSELVNEAAEQVLKFHRHLYDPSVNLYRHAWFSEDPAAKLPYWSRANGWAIWAVTEVLLYLPEKHPLRKDVLSIYRRHVDGLIRCQNAQTGFYPQLLDEPESFAETSGTAIFTMAIARGINNGWIPRSKYGQYVTNGWKALASVISPEGEVSGICMGTMCSLDRSYYRKRPVVMNDSHGLLGLIMAGIETDKFMKVEKK